MAPAMGLLSALMAKLLVVARVVVLVLVMGVVIGWVTFVVQLFSEVKEVNFPGEVITGKKQNKQNKP